MFCLVRTSSNGKPQAGITFLLVDMDMPGITVSPIISISGDHELNQVFFDGVRVPKANRVGDENDGWSVAKYLLEFERGGSYAPVLKVALDRLREMAADGAGGAAPIDDPAFRRKLAEAEIAVEAIEATEHRVLSAAAGGRSPGPLSSVLKIQGSEAMQRLDELAVEAAGHYAAVHQPVARAPSGNVPPVGPDHSLVAMPRYLNNRAASIYGGSNEIQRNIVAQLVLRL
jgi:acyl-CoA dehydrogenase